MNRHVTFFLLSFGFVWALAPVVLAQQHTQASQHASSRQSDGPSAAAAQGAARQPGVSGKVRILPTALEPNSTSIEIGSEQWVARGYDLKSLIAELYDVEPQRIDFPDAAAARRYDVVRTGTEDEEPAAVRQDLRRALQERFALAITSESRSMEVYVLTAPNGAGLALRPHRSAGGAARAKDAAIEVEFEEPQQFTVSSATCPRLPSGGIAASAASIVEFGQTLEQDLDRLMVDETNLAGRYDFEIGNYTNKEELFRLLDQQLGLVVVPSRREVTVIAVRPAVGRPLSASEPGLFARTADERGGY